MVLHGSRVVVTGGSSGIGLAIAEQLLARGARVALVGRNEARLARARQKLLAHPWARTLACDVTNPRAVRCMIRDAARILGGIDVLVNSAGQGVRGPVHSTSLDDARRVIEVNYLGAVHCTLHVLPRFQRQRMGVVVNVASVAGLYGVPDLAVYGASKAALVAFGRALRIELEEPGIRVVNVYPDYTRTVFFSRERRVGDARPPAGRYASPASVARRTIRAVERGGDEVILSARGRLLRVLGGLFPWLAECLLRLVARRLGTSRVGP
jgi:short-subunit dehydrogenase